MSVKNSYKVQGSLEYLLLLGAVLIVALIVISFIVGIAKSGAESIPKSIYGSEGGICKIYGISLGDVVNSDSDFEPDNTTVKKYFTVNAPANNEEITEAWLKFSNIRGWYPKDCGSNENSDCFHCFSIDGTSVGSFKEEPPPEGIELAIKEGLHEFASSIGIDSACTVSGSNYDDVSFNAVVEITYCSKQ